MADSYGSGYRAGEEWSEDHATEEQLIRVADFVWQRPKIRASRIQLSIDVCEEPVTIFGAWLNLMIGEYELDCIPTVEDYVAYNAMVEEEGGCDSLEHVTKYIDGFCTAAFRMRGVERVS